MNISQYNEGGIVRCCDETTVTCGGVNSCGTQDGRLITVSGCDEVKKTFYRATLNVCVKGETDCPRNDTRSPNILAKPYVLLHGLVPTCDGTLKHDSISVFPNEGQTVHQLCEAIFALLANGECWA